MERVEQSKAGRVAYDDHLRQAFKGGSGGAISAAPCIAGTAHHRSAVGGRGCGLEEEGRGGDTDVCVTIAMEMLNE